MRTFSASHLANPGKKIGLAILAALLLVGGAADARASQWVVGDVFAAIGNGEYQVYSNAGVLKETISQEMPGFTAGCGFDSIGDLYTTNFTETPKVVKFDDIHPHLILQIIDTGAQGGTLSESIVFAENDDFYVGHAGFDHDIQKYNGAGVFLEKFDVQIENVGSDWIDLAADQATMFYTSEGRRIFRFDVSTNTQLADFAVLPGESVPFGPVTAFALRLLPPGDGSGGLLVADKADIKRLDGSGNVIQTYDVDGEDSWFALNLDPDGTSFWSGFFGDTPDETGKFYKFDIATGAVLVGPVDTGVTVVNDPDTGTFTGLFGLCVRGEPTAGITPPKAPTKGKVTGGGQITLDNGGRASFGFNAQRKKLGGPAKGHLNYLDHTTRQHVNGPVNEIIADPAGPVTFSGTACDGTCTFTVTVADIAKPGGNQDIFGITTISDMFGITVSGSVTYAVTLRPIARGNIQRHF